MSPEVRDLDEAVATARRLQAMGIAIRSAELSDRADQQKTFVDAGGNRAIRRARMRAQRRRRK